MTEMQSKSTLRCLRLILVFLALCTSFALTEDSENYESDSDINHDYVQGRRFNGDTFESRNVKQCMSPLPCHLLAGPIRAMKALLDQIEAVSVLRCQQFATKGAINNPTLPIQQVTNPFLQRQILFPQQPLQLQQPYLAPNFTPPYGTFLQTDHSRNPLTNLPFRLSFQNQRYHQGTRFPNGYGQAAANIEYETFPKVALPQNFDEVDAFIQIPPRDQMRLHYFNANGNAKQSKRKRPCTRRFNKGRRNGAAYARVQGASQDMKIDTEGGTEKSFATTDTTKPSASTTRIDFEDITVAETN